MKPNRILSLLATLLGAGLIVAAFVHWRGETPTDILVLNIVVSVLVYALFFVLVLVPWIDWNNKSHKQVGSLGVRWVATWMYAIGVIATIVVCNMVSDVSFFTQLIIQGILLLLVILGFAGLLNASDSVEEVYQKEKVERQGLQLMREAMSGLKDKATLSSTCPNHITDRINELEESLRYLSPSNSPETPLLEEEFVDTISAVNSMLSRPEMYDEQIVAGLTKAEQLYRKRKSIYSH